MPTSWETWALTALAVLIAIGSGVLLAVGLRFDAVIGLVVAAWTAAYPWFRRGWYHRGYAHGYQDGHNVRAAERKP